MTLAYLILTIFLSVAFLAFGLAKVLRLPQMKELARRVNFSVNSYVVIGVLEVAAAAGLLLGIFTYRPFATAAASGLTLLMIGAIIVLIRAKAKPKECAPAFVLGVLSAVTVWLTLGA
jgi:uncharacterized membrane protein YphA (DoxX/SURF4 family)